jgi:hypothetical protein
MPEQFFGVLDYGLEILGETLLAVIGGPRCIVHGVAPVLIPV